MGRPAAVILALVFVVELTLFSILPVVPIYVHEFGLSKVQGGALIAVSSIAVAVISIPAGYMADRVGVRRVTIFSALLVVISCFGQAFAGSFDQVLAARLVYGFGSAVVWTAALAWLSDLSDDRSRSSTVGATAAAAGAGSLVGPAFAGYVAQHYSVEAAYLGIGVASAVVTSMLLFVPRGTAHEPEPASTRQVASLVRQNPMIVAALLMMTVSGFVDGVVNLLAPLELATDGLTAGQTGAVLSVAAALFVLASAAVSRRGGWAASVRTGGYACVLQAATFVPVVISLSALPVTVMVLLRAPLSGVIYTVAMPVAVIASRRGGIGTATVTGLVGTCWGVSSLIGPPVAGAIADAAGDATAYALGASLLLVSGLWILRMAAAERERAVAELPV